jgi:hypothetical protein
MPNDPGIPAGDHDPSRNRINTSLFEAFHPLPDDPPGLSDHPDAGAVESEVPRDSSSVWVALGMIISCAVAAMLLVLWIIWTCLL